MHPQKEIPRRVGEGEAKRFSKCSSRWLGVTDDNASDIPGSRQLIRCKRWEYPDHRSPGDSQ